MKIIPYLFTTAVLSAAFLACSQKKNTDQSSDSVAMVDTTIELPAPYATKSSTKFSNVVGWPEGKIPKAPAGFTVTEFARDLKSPRWIYEAPNGDIFVAEANTEQNGLKEKVINAASDKGKSQETGTSANRITLFRDTNQDGKPDLKETFLTGLNQPFGMLVLGNYFYVANTDGLFRYEDRKSVV